VNTAQSIPRFIYNGGYRNFHQELTANLEQCETFDIRASFKTGFERATKSAVFLQIIDMYTFVKILQKQISKIPDF